MRFFRLTALTISLFHDGTDSLKKPTMIKAIHHDLVRLKMIIPYVVEFAPFESQLTNDEGFYSVNICERL